MKKLENISYTVTIKLITGLHIGGGDSAIEIGGIDNQIIKDKDGYPYIPGSSLKGKSRSLFELSEGNFDQSGGPHEYCGNTNCLICRAFGISNVPKNKKEDYKNKMGKIGPARLIFRDIELSDGDKNKFKETIGKGGNPLEEKTEVTIDRNTGTGANPRPMERMPAGAEFSGEIVFRVFDTDGDGQATRDEEIAKELFETNGGKLKELLEADYLGGCGSRGSGQVKIDFKKR